MPQESVGLDSLRGDLVRHPRRAFSAAQSTATEPPGCGSVAIGLRPFEPFEVEHEVSTTDGAHLEGRNDADLCGQGFCAFDLRQLLRDSHDPRQQASSLRCHPPDPLLSSRRYQRWRSEGGGAAR